MHPAIAVPAIALLVGRAWRKKSLTPTGILAATLTAVAHAYHPWNMPFVLLAVFFLAGTRATHVKENVKATLTMHSKGSSGGEGPRTHVQVFANSLMASILSVLHAWQLQKREAAFNDPSLSNPSGSTCFSWGGDILAVGIIANYAAVAADTFSSELGILSKSEPRLIISPTLRKVPRGTNGGVTLLGLGAGLLGSIIIVTAAMLSTPTCNTSTASRPEGGAPWTLENRQLFIGGMIIWGTLGSVLDSVLGGLFQRSVKDVRTGKIVEGEGGVRVLVSDVKADHVVGGSAKRAEAKAAILSNNGEKAVAKADEVAVEEIDTPLNRFDPNNKHRKSSFGDERPSRVVENGLDWLDNNDINFLMAVMMSVGGMAVASWYWDVPLQSVIEI